MTSKKLSEIASGGNYNSLTDLVIAVRSAASDYQVQLPASLGTYNIFDYGAKGNGKKLTDVTTTSGSAVISSTSYSFVAADVGKLVTVATAAAPTTKLICGTISSVSSGNATLSGTIA